VGKSKDKRCVGNEGLNIMNTKRLFLVTLLVIVVATPAYIYSLNSLLPHQQMTFTSGMTIADYTNLPSGTIGWNDSSFSSGWSVDLTTSNKNNSGFLSNNLGGVLYYNFTGGAVNAVEVAHNVTLDVSVYKYLVVEYTSSTDEQALCFSAAVIGNNGSWNGLPWNHVSSAKQEWVYDITKVYSGTIKALRFRITNDFDKNYTGGVQNVTISSASLSSSLPVLSPLPYNALNTQIQPSGSNLLVSGTSPGYKQSMANHSIVSALLTRTISIDLSRYHYLNLTVKPSDTETYVRVVFWTNDSVSHTMLLANYDEIRWHQIIIDVRPFGISGHYITKMELGYLVYIDSENQVHSVEYGEISFNEAT
jgi:hypothetical protein